MNITLSQWLQIAAIAISAIISISRWVWDARRDKKTIADIQKISEANEPKARTQTPLANKLAYFLPLFVLFWQMLTPGDLTRFDLGLMMLGAITFIVFIFLGLRDSFTAVIASNYYCAKLYQKVLLNQSEQTSMMLDSVKNKAEAPEVLQKT